MKLLVVSDSHGNVRNIIRALTANSNIDMIIHLGDVVGDILRVRESFPALKYEYVRGNNDWSAACPSEKVLDVEGKKIFITHGHNYGVKKDYRWIGEKGRSIGAHAVFFGHTHINDEIFSGGIMLLNPGSISLPAGGSRPTCCVVTVTPEKIISRFLSIQ